MPRYEYRLSLRAPKPRRISLEWIADLDREFQDTDADHRSEVVRDALHQIYLGRAYERASPEGALGTQALIHSFDPRNVTLEPEYYGDVDAEKILRTQATDLVLDDVRPLADWPESLARISHASNACQSRLQILRQERKDFSRGRSLVRLQPDS